MRFELLGCNPSISITEISKGSAVGNGISFARYHHFAMDHQHCSGFSWYPYQNFETDVLKRFGRLWRLAFEFCMSTTRTGTNCTQRTPTSLYCWYVVQDWLTGVEA